MCFQVLVFWYLISEPDKYTATSLVYFFVQHRIEHRVDVFHIFYQQGGTKSVGGESASALCACHMTISHLSALSKFFMNDASRKEVFLILRSRN